jgi:hypothetical protein
LRTAVGVEHRSERRPTKSTMAKVLSIPDRIVHPGACKEEGPSSGDRRSAGASVSCSILGRRPGAGIAISIAINGLRAQCLPSERGAREPKDIVPVADVPLRDGQGRSISSRRGPEIHVCASLGTFSRPIVARARPGEEKAHHLLRHEISRPGALQCSPSELSNWQRVCSMPADRISDSCCRASPLCW